MKRSWTCLRDGDTRMVTEPVRLGRSVENVKETVDDPRVRRIGWKALPQGIDTTTPSGRPLFHMLAESEHDLIGERTHDGLAAARGREGDGRFRTTPTRAKRARAMYDTRQQAVQEIADAFGVPRGTIYRRLHSDDGSQQAGPLGFWRAAVRLRGAARSALGARERSGRG